MERPFPAFQPSISPIPEQERPTTAPYDDFLFYFLAACFTIPWTILVFCFLYSFMTCLRKCVDCCGLLIHGSYPDRTPTDITTATDSSSSSTLIPVRYPDRTPTDITTATDSSSSLPSIPVRYPHRTPTDITTATDGSSSSPSDTKVWPSELGDCPICWEELVEGKGLRKLPRCRHAYHQACIDQWLTMGSKICPVCRGRVS